MVVADLDMWQTLRLSKTNRRLSGRLFHMSSKESVDENEREGI